MRRVVEEGPYERTQKYSLILAVRPVGPPWYRFSKDAGTASHVFFSFLEGQVMRDLTFPSTLMRVNLRSHLTAVSSPTPYTSTPVATAFFRARLVDPRTALSCTITTDS